MIYIGESDLCLFFTKYLSLEEYVGVGMY